MRKLCSLILSVMMLVLCIMPDVGMAVESVSFSGMNDPALLTYLEGTMYEELVSELNSEGYFVENVQAVYISQEYLDELAFNSQANVYFGYTLEELDAQFQGEKYIFTLGDNNETVVEPWTAYDDMYERIIRNVVVGTGVILLCVTVSAVTAGVGAPAISMIFAMAAKGGAIGALSGAAAGGIPTFIAKGIETGDMEAAVKSAMIAGSEGFKWGAICGAISGGTMEAVGLKGATMNGLSMNDAAAIQRESKYPLDVIKGFRSMEQYKVCQQAGLTPKMVNGKMALVRKIDLDFVDEFGRTNLQRMGEGIAALDPTTGQAYQLHHIGQKMDSTLSILTEAEHMQHGNNLIWHLFGEGSKINRTAFNKQRAEFWKTLAASMK